MEKWVTAAPAEPVVGILIIAAAGGAFMGLTGLRLSKPRARGGSPQWTWELIDTRMTRNDIQNLMVLGEPAVKAELG